MREQASAFRCILFVCLAAGVLVTAFSCRTDKDPVLSSEMAASLSPAASSVAPAQADVERAITLGFTFQPSLGRGARTEENADKQSIACLSCHNPDSHSMHAGIQEYISCVDCHGGHGDLTPPMSKMSPSDVGYDQFKDACHVQPSLKDFWPKSGLPQVPGAIPLQESPDYIRFINPGDLRAAEVACYSCHSSEVTRVRSSMMANGDMLWGAALYNNGAINQKNAVYGEAYTTKGTPAEIIASPLPTTRQTQDLGWLPELFPLPRWEITQPGNILRVFERGGEIRPVIGIPDPAEQSGRPDVKLSVRGLGTDVRTDPVFLGLQKTRLLDPTLNLFGTNDHPGDFRSSGCTACHVVYANDSSPVHSTFWAQYGNDGKSHSIDTTIPKDQSGHPIEHKFVRSVPTSTCIVCHVHPGTNVLNSYLGFTWWDNETDGQFLYPAHQKYPSSAEQYQVSQHNPEQAAARGLWSDLYPNDVSAAGQLAGPNFLENLSQLNGQFPHMQVADFHGHGWIFRAVFKKDRHGRLLDSQDQIIQNVTPSLLAQAVQYQSPDGQPSPPGVPVHLKDIHLERGMQCDDCHFEQDAHGDGHLYGETRGPVEVDCIDCHGTVDKPAKILQYLQTQDRTLLDSLFTGNAAGKALSEDQKNDLLRNIVNRHFVLSPDGARLFQFKASVNNYGQSTPTSPSPSNGWYVTQTQDTLDRSSDWGKRALNVQVNGTLDSKGASPASQFDWARLAHTIRADGMTWGDIPSRNFDNPLFHLAHDNNTVTCYACHTSWNTSCFGCHLPMRANMRKPMLHNEGLTTRNYTNYNYQTLRDDLYMLGVDSTVKHHKVVPVRSACAVLVSSQDANRQWIYTQQQTVSAGGLAGTAFSPYFPHTVRTTETRRCTDCHVSSQEDNNAIMAQLLMQGTHAVNFIGRFAWVGLGSHGLQAVAVTERDEPQAVIGSQLHKLAYPDFYQQHLDRGMELTESYGHAGNVRDLQLRGEYLYAACGSDGFIAYDVAHIDDKGFSQRIITAPVSALGQRFFVPTRSASSVCAPSTMAIDPTRPQDNREANEEPAKIAPLYAYIYVTDEKEGLVVVGNPPDSPNRPGVATLLDGNPDNNYLQRAATFNPGGLLNGARSMSLYGNYAYICCDAGIVVVDLSDPLNPRYVTKVDPYLINHPKKIVFQFRYGFVIDDSGVKVLDVTFPQKPLVMLNKDGNLVGVGIPDARDIYVSRTYGYVAAGKNGIAILNLESPRDSQTWGGYYFNDGGKLNDATAVRIGMTNASMYAYVADGRNGLKVLQLTSADDEPSMAFLGFSPQPQPRVIAKFQTDGPAIALSGGLDRDRAVDESGNQLSVFGRRGARPFNLEEQQRLFLHHFNSIPELYTVDNRLPPGPIEPDPKRFRVAPPPAPDNDQGQ